jgi:pentose-5-phosphate-3-epimerase
VSTGYCKVYSLSSQYIEAFSLETGEQTKKIAIDGSYIKESLGQEVISFTQFVVSETHIFTASSIMQYMSAINIKTRKVE